MSDQFNTGQRTIVETPDSRRSWFTRRRIIVIAVVGTGVVVLLGWLIITPKATKEDVSKLPKAASHVPYDPPKSIPAVVAVAPKPPEAPPAIIQPFVQATPPAIVAQAPAAAPPPPPRRQAVYTFGGAGSVPEYMKPKAASDEASKSPAVSTSIAYKSAAIAGSKTMTIPDRNLMLMPGPLICIMDTAINTDVAGPFQCHLDRDAVSPTNVVLMEKGTKVQGGYTSSVATGQSRVIAVTANAITPNGVVVPLGGPIADEIGAGGVEGSVDNHWMQRIGGALLLSIIDGAFQLAQAELQKSGSTNLNISSGSGVSTLASQLLAKTINIPPTITLNQGTTVALWNTGIIDFSPSYKLEMAR